MKTWMKSVILTSAFVVLASSSFATLLGVNPGYPKVGYLTASAFAVTYTASNQLFSVTAPPTTVAFSAPEGLRAITGIKNFQIQILVDNTGALAGGVPGDDLVLSGNVTRIVGGVTNTYTGVLLTGEVMAFGFLEGGSIDSYEMRFTPTGGALAGFFCGAVGVQLTSGASTFTNDFTVNFRGQAKGNAGSEDVMPPTIVCPADITAECHTDTNGLTGAYVGYPIPVVTDNCDPNPAVVCTPPSGSFFPLPTGVSTTNYVVTCVAQDAAGNTNTCSFIVTVQDTLPPEFTDTNNPVINCDSCGPNNAITLTNDAGFCHATFAFPKPYATDNCCPLIIPANVSAVDENGVTITLADLGNGMLQGQFPVNVSGTNMITITANDGRGNSTQHLCPVVVVDRDPPIILCTDQTVTFKPIFTNALSCITEEFDDDNIKAGDYIWFSSVIKPSSCGYNNSSFTVHIFDASIQISVDDTNITLDVPEAYVTFSNGVAASTTVFTNGQWITVTKPGLSGNTFASGLAWQAPFDLNCNGGRWDSYRKCWSKPRRHVNSVTWCGRFAVDKPGVVIQWQWAASVHDIFSGNHCLLDIKPCDDKQHSLWKNCNRAGSCQKYKSYVKRGARCDRRWRDNDRDDDVGILSDCKRANLGKGMICLGAVEFAPPTAADNCGHVVSLSSTPPSGSILGPGVYPVTWTAVDSSGNSNQCASTLTVLSPLQVVFDTPCNDNLNDNTAEPDEGFTDMNCPDDPSTPQIITRFYSGDKVCHSVRLFDCNGIDVTADIGPFVTVHMDVTEREGIYSNSILINDVPQNYVCVGSPGGIMVLNCGKFQYYLDTRNYEAGTVYNNRFFRSCVWVDYNSSPGVPVGMEDVILESK